MLPFVTVNDSGTTTAHDTALRNWPWLVGIALSGFLLAIFGTYWDDAWHTEKGRDTFLAAPHIALYAGISLAGGALALWALFAARRTGWRDALRHPALLLAASGIAITFVAAPADNAWHEAFGRDAVIWSPPHMLGVAGSLAIAAGLLLELAPGSRSRAERAAALLAAAAVVAVAAIPVLEYETDVPQFDLAFYLPALAAGAAFAFGLVRLALPGPWPATRAALAYTAVMALVGVILLTAEMPAPLLPLLVAPALVFDLATARLPRPLAAAVFALGVYAAYVPYLNWIKSDVQLDAGDVAAGLPIAFAGTLLALWLTSRERARRPRLRNSPAAAALGALTLAVAPAGALAHDPGQGTELTTASVLLRSDGDRAELEVDLSGSGHCDDLAPQRVVARRAGEERAASLRRLGPCRVGGQVALPDRGRWFVYAELEHDGRTVETWLPIHADGTETASERERSVYFPAEVSDPPVKSAVGIAIFAVFAGALVGIPILYRRALHRDQR